MRFSPETRAGKWGPPSQRTTTIAEKCSRKENSWKNRRRHSTVCCWKWWAGGEAITKRERRIPTWRKQAGGGASSTSGISCQNMSSSFRDIMSLAGHGPRCAGRLLAKCLYKAARLFFSSSSLLLHFVSPFFSFVCHTQKDK